MSRFEKFHPAAQQKVAFASSNGSTFIDYKNAEVLRKLMSPNGKILGRKRTGLTAHHQRLLGQAIKRARYMALLPYTSATA